MNQAEFYRPVTGLLDPEWLQMKRVAAELGRMGVHLLLVERPGERIEEHNIVRHLLGYRSLGKSKLSEMARHVRNLNPTAHVRSCSLDVVEQQPSFERLLARWHPDLVAVCTDNEPSKHAINEVALRLKLPQTGGAVYEGGIGGEVYRVPAGGACYGCLAAQLQLHRQVPKGATPDYTGAGNHRTPTTVALNLDIEQIALLQCRMTLEMLLEPSPGLTGLPPEVNLCVFANRLVPGTFARPWHAEFFSVERRPDCLGCGQAPANVEAEAGKILSTLQGAAPGSPTQPWG